MRTPILAIVLTALLGIFAGGGRAAAEEPKRPNLVIVIVIDQLRYDYLTRFADLFDAKAGAFLGFQHNGVFYTNANYGHATTYTGPGHTHILTGGYAYQTGMVGNRWFDRASGKTVAIAGDPDHHFVGGEGDEGEGTSPRNLIGTTVGDELILDTQGRAKVISIALKSRASILLGGKLGKAYWFSDKGGGFITSSYYAKELPAYVQEWNKKRLADSFFGKSWTPSVPDAAFARASEDDMPWEGDLFGLGRAFPHKITGGKGDKPGPEYYEALVKTPYGNEVELDFARAVIEAEQLGQHDEPDMIAISLSANDEVGHTFGPYSREVLDMTVQTDRQLGAFIGWLGNLPMKGGDRRAVVVLTADHGASPMPEYMTRQGIEAYRIKKKAISEAVEKALAARFGPCPEGGEWVIGLEDPSVYLNEKAIAEASKAFPLAANVREMVENVAAQALCGVPGIARCYTRTQLLSGAVGGESAVGRAYQVCFYPPRSGDVLIVTKPYSFWGKYAEKDYGDSHGTHYAYDTHVPLAFLGKDIAPETVSASVSMADVAPTIAALLRVNPPPCAEGRVLERVLRGGDR